MNIINNENLLNHTINVANEFGKNKKKIIVFGTGGSNLGARALNDIIFEKKCKIEFYDNIDPIFLGCKFSSFISLNLLVALSSAIFLISKFLFTGGFFWEKFSPDLKFFLSKK